MSFLTTLKNDFEKLWHEAPKAETIAASAISFSAPFITELIGLTAGAPAEAEASAVLTKVKTDMAVVSTLVSTGQTSSPSFATALSDITTNLGGILSVAQIKDPATVSKVTSITDTVIEEIEAVQQAFAPVKS
jgi:hypothetical protein